MDLFNFLVTIILVFLAVQYHQPWIVFAILIISILTIKSLRLTIGLVAAALLMYFFFDSGSIQSYFPLIILGVLVIGLILGVGKGEEQPQSFGGGGGYADLLGGFGGGQGMGGGEGY